jgi:two-component system sensor histidine kinase VicK
MALDTTALRYLEAITEETNQVFYAYDIDSKKFLMLTPAFEAIWHKRRKSVMENGDMLLKTIHPADQQHIQAAHQDLVQGRTDSIEMEFRILLRGKTERWICVKSRLLPDDMVLIGYANDITEQKAYNDYLKKFSDKKNTILNIISHDLAAPLAMINNVSSLLEADIKSTGNAEMHQLIGLIEKCSKYGLQFIHEFINQEFMESATVELIRRRVDLVKVFRDSMEEYQFKQQMLNKTFTFQPATESIYMEVDDNKFMQVVNNLISNALKFTPDGGEISVALEEKAASVLITVADTGVGIPEKYHATLFEKFTQARRSGIKGEPSVGLGMSIIKTIVEWHQGKIWFESEVNKGTTFYIEIPKIAR